MYKYKSGTLKLGCCGWDDPIATVAALKPPPSLAALARRRPV
jgi:hypothetical protein